MRAETFIGLLLLAVCVAIVWIVFVKLRAKSLAMRGLYALGFMGLLFTALLGMRSQAIAWLIASTALPFGILAVIETWGPKEESPKSMTGEKTDENTTT